MGSPQEESVFVEATSVGITQYSSSAGKNFLSLLVRWTCFCTLGYFLIFTFRRKRKMLKMSVWLEIDLYFQLSSCHVWSQIWSICSLSDNYITGQPDKRNISIKTQPEVWTKLSTAAQPADAVVRIGRRSRFWWLHCWSATASPDRIRPLAVSECQILSDTFCLLTKLSGE